MHNPTKCNKCNTTFENLWTSLLCDDCLDKTIESFENIQTKFTFKLSLLKTDKILRKHNKNQRILF